MSKIIKMALLLSVGCGLPFFTTANTPPADDRFEVFEVTGQRTMAQLKKRIDKAEVEFYDLLNHYNKKRKYDVVCRVKREIGTRIGRKVCEPRYVTQARTRLIMQNAVSGLTIDFRRMPDEGLVMMASKEDKANSIQHMQRLIKDTPELQEKFLELQALRYAYSERKAETLNGTDD